MSISTLDAPSIIPVACRYVSTDQWLVTHINSSYSILQVKQHLLGKLVPPPPGPTSKPRRTRRERPLSPITFSSHGHSEGDADSENLSNDDERSEQDTLADVSDDVNYYKFKYYPSSRPAGSSSTLVVQPSSSSSHPTSNQRQKSVRSQACARYTLLAFSTGQLLEDHFNLAWYALRPYELLELYPPAHTLVTLPRHVPDAYIRPYFEARVWALRVVGADVSGESIGELQRPSSKGKSAEKDKGKARQRDRRTGSGSGTGPGDGGEEMQRENGETDDRKREKKGRKRRKQMEWRERWVIIHQGVLKLCKDRNDPHPAHTAPLSALLSLRGGEYLYPHMSAPHSLAMRGLGPSPSSSTSTPLSSPTFLQDHLYPPHADTTQSTPTSPGLRGAGSDATSDLSRIICAKFRAGPHPPPHSPTYPYSNAQHYPSSSSRASFNVGEEHRGNDGDAGGGWWRRGSRDASASDWSAMRKGRSAGHELKQSAARSGAAHDRLGVEDAEADETCVWIVMDMLSDAAHDNILRILHRHASNLQLSSFVAQPNSASSTLPEPGYTFPASLAPQQASPQPSHASMSASSTGSVTGTPVAAPHIEAKQFQRSLPYPEWRTAVVQRARKAGLGVVGRAMELFMFGDDAHDDTAVYDENDIEATPTVQRSTSPSVATLDDSLYAPSPPDGSMLPVSPMLWNGTLDDDSDSSAESEKDDSEQEWADWAEDLPRQRYTQAHTEDRRLRQLERGTRTLSAVDEAGISWARAWAAPAENEDEPEASDEDVAANDYSLPSSADASTSTWAADTRAEAVGPSHSRTLNSYSSVDSLIRHTMRTTPARLRPRILETAGDSLTSINSRVRPRSPLSAQVQTATMEPANPPASAAAPLPRSSLPVRMPIPVPMRMTTMRTSTVTGVDETAPNADSPLSPRLRTSAGRGKTTTSRDDSTRAEDEDVVITKQKDVSSRASSSHHGLRPRSLKTSSTSASSSQAPPETEVFTSSSQPSSPSSLESITFVVPDSD